MGRKIIIFIAGLLLAGLAGCGTINLSNDVGSSVAKAAGKIAGFDLPAGYQADFSVEWMGYTLAAYRPGDDSSHLYLLQSSQDSDAEILAKMMNDLLPGWGNNQSGMTVMESYPADIRGQATTVVVSEGQNHEGLRYRQVMAPFAGKGGPALLVFSRPVNNWDQAVVDAFLASIR